MPLVNVPESFLSQSYWEDCMFKAIHSYKSSDITASHIVCRHFTAQVEAVLTIPIKPRQQVRIIKILCKAKDHVLWIATNGKEGKSS